MVYNHLYLKIIQFYDNSVKFTEVRSYMATYRAHWRLTACFKVISAITLTAGYLSTSGNRAFAQSNIVPDTTLGAESTFVVPNFSGLAVEAIGGGAVRGQNLFHSFQEFNVSEDRGAYFFSPNADIQNILARVTGTNRSDILGVLGTFGNSQPNLFLINPNGIFFGPNAQLNVEGSFFATTANAVQFGQQGFFSATNPEAPPLLTVNPSAFFFNQLNAGTITNRSVARNPVVPSFIEGLRVPNRENLVLLGGNVSIDGGQLNAFGGRVEIGAIAGTGTVELNADGSLNFPTDVQRYDVSFTNGAGVNVSLNNGGDIAITGRNIDIS